MEENFDNHRKKRFKSYNNAGKSPLQLLQSSKLDIKTIKRHKHLLLHFFIKCSERKSFWPAEVTVPDVPVKHGLEASKRREGITTFILRPTQERKLHSKVKVLLYSEKRKKTSYLKKQFVSSKEFSRVLQSPVSFHILQ